MDAGNLAQWTHSPLSPASEEPYTPSNPSSSRHPSQSTLPQPNFAAMAAGGSGDGMGTASGGHFSTFDPYPPVFETEGDDHLAKAGGLRNQQALYAGMGHVPQPGEPAGPSLSRERWYDPQGADSYTTTQAFLAAQNVSDGQANQQTQMQMNLPAGNSALSDARAFREQSGFDPSPFASPTTSSHHRTHSFGSDLESPPPPPPLFNNLSQHSLSEGHANAPWPHAAMSNYNNRDMGALGGIEGMTLADNNSNFSPVSRPMSNPQTFIHQGMHPNASASSLHSQSSFHSAHQQQQSLTDDEVQQLIAQHSGQQEPADPSAQSGLQQPIVPQVSVQGASTNDLTFEQILQQLSSEAPLSEATPGVNQVPFPPPPAQHQHIFPSPQQPAPAISSGVWTHHQNASAPDIAHSPWPHDTSLIGGVSRASLETDAFAPPSQDQPVRQTPEPSAVDRLPRPIPTFGPVRQPTREDSFDKLKKYLKLDVNMAYTGPQDDSPTTSGMRKRSASDAGPALLSLMRGNDGTASGAVFGKGSRMNAEPADINDVLNAKQGLPAGEALDGSTVAMPMFANGGASGNSWGQAGQQEGNAPGGRTVSGGGVGPMRSTAFSAMARESGAGTPYSQARPANTPRRSGGASSAASSASSNAGHGNIGPPGHAGGWAFPGRPGGGHNAGSHSQRRPPYLSAGHRRAAQSEDLSQRNYHRDPSDFLRTITAPDGSLAPPGAAAYARPQGSPQYYASAGAGAGIDASFQPQQVYSTSHDRHASSDAGSTDGTGGISPSAFQRSPQQQAYLSTATYASLQAGSPTEGSDSPSPLPSISSPAYSSVGATAGSPAFSPPGAGPPGQLSRGNSPVGYSQTALPTYTTIAPRRNNASSPTTTAMPQLSPSLANPAVQTVTTTATQAASASRRKNDAHFVCPVPGCGSQFTRQFNLRSHLRSHADERPFKCAAPGCNKAFARAHDAKRHHETLHLSVKKYICEYCARQFARLDALHRHLKPESGPCAEQAAAAAAAGGGEENGSASTVADSLDGMPAQMALSDHDRSRNGSFAGHVM